MGTLNLIRPSTSGLNFTKTSAKASALVETADHAPSTFLAMKSEGRCVLAAACELIQLDIIEAEEIYTDY